MERPSPKVVVETVGPLISGTWIQQLLLGFILAQMFDYYRDHYARDAVFNRYMVGLLLFFNLFIGGQDFHVLWRVTVQYYGDYSMFDLQEWTMWTEPLFTAVVGLLAQTFFVMRAWKIAHSIPVLILLSALTLFSFGSGITVSSFFIKYERFSSLSQFKTPITLWLVSTSVCDLAISAVLVYYLVKSKTTFKKTDRVINRIIQLAMETSSLTAFVAMMNLVLFLPLQTTAYHLLPQFSISRVYTLTVMATLLARGSLRSVLDSTGHASIPTNLRGGATTDVMPRMRVGLKTATSTFTDTIMEPPRDMPTVKSHDIELGVVEERSESTSMWDDRKDAAL
ncbi:hypothetical protein CYLTODRAFT_425576 [Cylindrobasidium torrendii FP15055 ss-10]|uniref:DUF6534 domain-containing protein n=1 Tax=Cylindrobasidium torrendii FP15055 ss-10 TaxID=1314674 RepID=A0A0D7B1K2_9AGAR|nr:hypothetical protein CYLTODRAFT_425576 [Cylindrobasidium torrendii FP15055 ss-10]